jgi:hypothetical protein
VTTAVVVSESCSGSVFPGRVRNRLIRQLGRFASLKTVDCKIKTWRMGCSGSTAAVRSDSLNSAQEGSQRKDTTTNNTANPSASELLIKSSKPETGSSFSPHFQAQRSIAPSEKSSRPEASDISSKETHISQEEEGTGKDKDIVMSNSTYTKNPATTEESKNPHDEFETSLVSTKISKVELSYSAREAEEVVDSETLLEPEQVDVRKKQDFFGAARYVGADSPPMVPIDKTEQGETSGVMAPDASGGGASHPPRQKKGAGINSELDGIDWDKAEKRRHHFKRGSMPNVLSTPAAIRTDQPSTGSFMRTASSAEDDAVGAIRTRIMNATFLRRKSTENSANSFQAKAQGHRRLSMPHMSMSMPAHALKQVFLRPFPLNFESCRFCFWLCTETLKKRGRQRFYFGSMSDPLNARCRRI